MLVLSRLWYVFDNRNRITNTHHNKTAHHTYESIMKYNRK